ncbi:glycosyltransferase family 8 protein [Annulohypoxylon maeteangense]|uniref:glycosyltransferase family 8 protein n=1 Tax=Annulohypoxylon maeteangense TaxID=1927788 RepID=UPI002007981A|nr:glycosyltransferase family 8 protein [Annulohypoxylon maeteangense]KAI0884611.1 glycosyltransferase family 8 protein [Annulohypoxylon maeteangense]
MTTNGNGVKQNGGAAENGDGWYDPTKIWTTLLTNRAYFGGLLVLHHSLRRHRSKYRLHVMVTRAVEEDTEYMEAFAAAGIPTIVVDKIEPAPRDGKINKGTWEKLAPWSFTQYERVVLLDSDQVILQNIDDMMEVDIPEGWIASTHACTCNPRKLPHYSKDWVPANCAFTAADQATGAPAPITAQSPNNHHLLNSGTVIVQPSKAQYDELIHAMNTHPDVPNMIFFDQDLLAIVYRGRWKPLPYHYNALKPMRACHGGLWKDGDVKILHYILNKPWKSRAFDEGDTIESTHGLWWEEFGLVEREWIGSEDQRKRELWGSVVVPVVAQE